MTWFFRHFHFDTHLKISKDVRPLLHCPSPSSHIVGLTVELFYKKWVRASSICSIKELAPIYALSGHSTLHKIPQTDLSSKTDYPNAPYICYFGGTPKKGSLQSNMKLFNVSIQDAIVSFVHGDRSVFRASDLGILKAKGSSNGKAPKNQMLKTKSGHDKSSKAPKNHTLESKVGSDDSTRLPQHCMLKAKGGHDKSSKAPKNHMLKAKGGHDKSSKAPKNHILQVKGGKDDSTKASNNHILKAKGEIDGSAKAPKNHILKVKGESRDSTELTSRKRSSPFTEGSKPLLKVSLIAEDNAGDPVNHFRPQNLLRVSKNGTINFDGNGAQETLARIAPLSRSISYMNAFRRGIPVTNVSRSASSILAINIASCVTSSWNSV
eukprot:scaffold10544_cov269-Chaetoceros_neogracile.AAC.6